MLQYGKEYRGWIFLPRVGSFCHTFGTPKWQKDPTPLYLLRNRTLSCCPTAETHPLIRAFLSLSPFRKFPRIKILRQIFSSERIEKSSEQTSNVNLAAIHTVVIPNKAIQKTSHFKVQIDNLTKLIPRTVLEEPQFR